MLQTLELKRYAKDSLPSTVRAVMRFLFKDKLLNIFSYKGQKGKKVFYTLTICSVIFGNNQFFYLILIVIVELYYIYYVYITINIIKTILLITSRLHQINEEV